MFADLFPSGRGRPSVPPDVVAAVMVLQALHGLSDRQAAEAVTFDLRWKAAVGLPVTAAAFHPTTLTVWRRRLAASGRPSPRSNPPSAAAVNLCLVGHAGAGPTDRWGLISGSCRWFLSSPRSSDGRACPCARTEQ